LALHCATALALLWFFRADWVRIIRGLIVSALRGLRERRLGLQTADERLAWMIVIATIPVGLTGIALEHTFRTLFAKARGGRGVLVHQRAGAAGRRATAPRQAAARYPLRGRARRGHGLRARGARASHGRRSGGPGPS
jgi:undecaprenyl-diphosphatase